jgi:hypothetical protein
MNANKNRHRWDWNKSGTKAASESCPGDAGVKLLVNFMTAKACAKDLGQPSLYEEAGALVAPLTAT